MSFDVCGPWSKFPKKKTLQMFNVSSEKCIATSGGPSCRGMLTVDEREKSFLNWSELYPCPKEMSQACFFSLGESYRVRCFYCYGGLGSWEPGDILLIKGKHFVEDVLKKQITNENYQSNSASLTTETEESKNTSLCKICLVNELEIVFLPCSHLVCCTICAASVEECCICREKIDFMLKVFVS